MLPCELLLYLAVACSALAAPSQHVLQPFQQPEASEPAFEGPTRRLEWGELNVIATTDTHGWLRGHLGSAEPEPHSSGDWGDLYSFVTHMKRQAKEIDVDLIMVDSGDIVDGNGLVDADPVLSGSTARDFFAEMPYDLLTVGNHGLYRYDVAHHIATRFVPRWNGRYLASNVNITIEGTSRPFAPRFRRWTTTKGLRIFSMGVLFDFKLPAKGLSVQSPREMVRERWFLDEMEKREEVDAFVLVGHMPVYDPAWRAVLKAIRQYYPTTPVLFFGGHAHVRDCSRPDERSITFAAGRYMETVGWLAANVTGKEVGFSRRFMDQNRRTYLYHSDTNATSFDTKQGLDISRRLEQTAIAFNLSSVYGYAPQSYYLNRFPYTHRNSLARFLTHEVFPALIRNESRPAPPLAVVNTGSTRFDISAGAFTVDSQYLVLPFLNRNVFIRDVPRELASVLVPNLHGEPGDEDLVSSTASHTEASATAYEASLLYASDHKLSYGYVTLDRCEGAGDDTRHRPLPAYRLPEYVGTDLPEGELIDIAFFDFIGPVILRTLNRLQGERVYTAVDIEPYSDMTSNRILGEYAKRFWPQEPSV